MLAQAVLASYEEPPRDGVHKGQLTVTGVSPCPYATYINHRRLDYSPPTPQQILVMKNGHWQEREIVSDLHHAGFRMRYTGKDQLTLHVGKVPLTGRPDGLITVDGREDILSIKAMNSMRFRGIRDRGLAAEPGIKCQEQLYLASRELKGKYAGCWVYSKHKDSCKPFDLFEEADPSYSKPIIEAMEEIVLGKAEVSRPKSPIDHCAYCRHSTFCWGEDLFDTSRISIQDIPGVVAQWKEGKAHRDYGKELIEEARVVLDEHTGDSRMLLVEDLKVLRIHSVRTGISMSKFVEKYGAAALAGVLEENPVESMKVLEV